MKAQTKFATLAGALIAATVLVIAVALWRYPAFFGQPGAMRFLVEPLLALLLYAVAVVLLLRLRAGFMQAVLPTVLVFGSLSALMQVSGFALENGLFGYTGHSLPNVLMLLTFAFWGAAGYRAIRLGGTRKTALSAAMLSAGLCMLVAVACGCAVEFFLQPPAVAEVLGWVEYTRSGWNDVRAFAVANTLDSAFTHLVFAPFVAAVTVFPVAAFVASRKAKTHESSEVDLRG